MKDRNFLKQLRDDLIDIRVTLHDTVEPSVISELDDIILSIEKLIEKTNNQDQYDNNRILGLIGRLIIALPTINEIFDYLSD